MMPLLLPQTLLRGRKTGMPDQRAKEASVVKRRTERRVAECNSQTSSDGSRRGAQRKSWRRQALDANVAAPSLAAATPPQPHVPTASTSQRARGGASNAAHQARPPLLCVLGWLFQTVAKPMVAGVSALAARCGARCKLQLANARGKRRLPESCGACS